MLATIHKGQKRLEGEFVDVAIASGLDELLYFEVKGPALPDLMHVANGQFELVEHLHLSVAELHLYLVAEQLLLLLPYPLEGLLQTGHLGKRSLQV